MSHIEILNPNQPLRLPSGIYFHHKPEVYEINTSLESETIICSEKKSTIQPRKKLY